jgi:serine/threonine protein kinase
VLRASRQIGSRDSSIRVARYLLGERVGRGGIAEVYTGFALGDEGFQKPVAIKRLLPGLASDEIFVARLIAETRRLIGLHHGNIVSVIDLARELDDVLLIMDFVDGPTLRRLLAAHDHRGLPLGLVTYIIQSVAAGLEFAHTRPSGAIIHADLHPSNVLITSSGEVRVADFWIARTDSVASVAGKWSYMSPEQLRREPLSPRSDVFSLGLVLYELLTGLHPFEGGHGTRDRRGVEPARIVPPRTIRPEIPLELEDLCLRALAHEPRNRFARMQQIVDAIVEQRFTHRWRDEAPDLALAIRGIPTARVPEPAQRLIPGMISGTIMTASPVTMFTDAVSVFDDRQTMMARGSIPRLETGGRVDPFDSIETREPLDAREPVEPCERVETREPVEARAPDAPTIVRGAPPSSPPAAYLAAFRLPAAPARVLDLARVHRRSSTSRRARIGQRPLERWLLIALGVIAFLATLIVLDP